MSTSAPPVVCVFNPLSSNHFRNATSWVPPNCGVARVFPTRSDGPLISGLTTSAAPLFVAPATIRMASPLDLAKALIAGFGPMYVASMAPDSRASMAAGPALKVLVSSLVSPSAAWKVPSFTPSTAEAWVTFGKYPSFRVSAPAAGAAPPLETAEAAAAAEVVDPALEESPEEHAEAVIATTATIATAGSRERRGLIAL